MLSVLRVARDEAFRSALFLFLLPKYLFLAPVFLQVNCKEIMALLISYDCFIHIGLCIDRRNRPFGSKSANITS